MDTTGVYQISLEQPESVPDFFFSTQDTQLVSTDPFCKASVAIDTDALFCGYYANLKTPRNDEQGGFVKNFFVDLKFEHSTPNTTMTGLSLYVLW